MSGTKRHSREAGRAVMWVAIVGAVVFGVGMGVFMHLDPVSPKFDYGRQQLHATATALHVYAAKHGRYPTPSEGLRALVTDQILESVPRDPWDFEIHYELEGSTARVMTYGRDGQPGGTGLDADLDITVNENPRTP